jgi:hypothetical protein
MAYTKEIYNSCSIPKNFINLFLQFKALETSINTDHYAEAIELYNKFIKDLKPNAVNVKTCSCNG